MAMRDVEVRTLAGPKHSGQFGGAAPDALIALLHALASLHDDHGDVAVAGLRREEWTGASYSDEEFRELAEVLPGMPLHRHRRPRLARLVGPGDHGHRASTCRRSTSALNAVVAVRAGQDQPARPSRAGRRRGAGRARAASRGPAAVRDRARGHARPRPATASPRRPPGRPTRRRARRSRRPGAARRRRGDRRLDPARQRAAGGGARGRDPAGRRRPTATPTSTRRTSACCSTSSRRRWSPRPTFFGRFAELGLE